MAAGLKAGELPRTTRQPRLTDPAQTPEAGSGPLISGAAVLEGKALTALAGLSAYSSSSGGRIAALKTRLLILLSYQKFQNVFRETSRGQTSHIDDVRRRARTRFSDKRPIVGMKSLGRGVQEFKEFKEC